MTQSDDQKELLQQKLLWNNNQTVFPRYFAKIALRT
jgi:hypothetical protein